MTRLSTDQLRQIAVTAKREEKAEQIRRAAELKRLEKEDQQNQERRSEVWKILYIAAINGAYQAHVQNLKKDDVSYFERLGFSIVEIFIRTHKKSTYEKSLINLNLEVSKLDKKITELENKIDDFKESSIGFYTGSIEDWLYENQTLAYACDLEPWFGPELKDIWIQDLESLESLKESVEASINNSKDKDRIKSLKQLLKEIDDSKIAVDESFDLNEAEDEAAELGERILELEYEIAGIEEDYGFIHEDDVKILHEFDWDNLSVNSRNTSDSSYNVVSLKWFCSTAGQHALKLLENDALALSKLGIRKISLRCIDYEGPVYLVNNSGTFNGKFPSAFDFLESMRLLNYKITGLKNNWS
jgi:hypothetical protein